MASAGVAVSVTLSPFFHDHHVLIRITSAVDDDVRACSLYIDTEDGFLATSALVGMDDGKRYVRS